MDKKIVLKCLKASINKSFLKKRKQNKCKSYDKIIKTLYKRKDNENILNKGF